MMASGSGRGRVPPRKRSGGRGLDKEPEVGYDGRVVLGIVRLSCYRCGAWIAGEGYGVAWEELRWLFCSRDCAVAFDAAVMEAGGYRECFGGEEDA